MEKLGKWLGRLFIVILIYMVIVVCAAVIPS